MGVQEHHVGSEVHAVLLPLIHKRTAKALGPRIARPQLFCAPVGNALLKRTSLLILLIGSLLCLGCYSTGLAGNFLFDDYANLPALGATGPIRDWPSFERYVTSGSADPTGRPMAMLSFLLDARDWPADPLAFKTTNLAIHILNGWLLFFVLSALGRLLSTASSRRKEIAAALGALIWLLHPLLVSTTLYIVQREAMLPATFTLLGLLAWLSGRASFAGGRLGKGFLQSAGGLICFTILATASKANGILLPSLVLAIEGAFPFKSDDSIGARCHGWLVRLLCVLPTVCIAAALGYVGWQGLIEGKPTGRPWTLGERLLTEPRVLVEYLKLIWLPRPFTPGLFNDTIQASTSLWSPATTLPAVLAVTALFSASLCLRKRAPALSVAVLFYFVGQSLESTTIPLELYFEHRNYLPTLLMFWPLALWLCGVPLAAPASCAEDPQTGAMTRRSRDRMKFALAMAILVGLAAMTLARASLWGNTRDQALLWAKLNPASARAQANAAQAEMNAGHPERAAQRLAPALAHAPDEVQLALNLLGARCRLGDLDPETEAAAVLALRTSRDTGTLLTSWFDRVIEQTASPPCPQLDIALVEKLLDAALANPKLTSQPGRRQDLYYLQGRIALARRQPEAALADFNRALDQQVRATAALRQAALLGSSGYPAQGLAHLDHYQTERHRETRPAFGMPRVHAWVLDHQQYWDTELARLRNTLLADLRTQGHSIQ